MGRFLLCEQIRDGGQSGAELALSVPDGYASARPVIPFGDLLRGELQGLLTAVHFWEKDSDWLRARAAVLRMLPTAQTGAEFARHVLLPKRCVRSSLPPENSSLLVKKLSPQKRDGFAGRSLSGHVGLSDVQIMM